MNAMVIEGSGSAATLVARVVDDPVPRGDEVVLRVRACAVNRADVLQRRGLYPAPEDAPAEILGLECSGEIERIGPRVRDWRVGERVMALLGGGGYAERVRVPASLLLPAPRGWSWVEAAAMPECHLTAFDALTTRARLRAGETVLIHAAASGVGLAALCLARTLGANAIATSRSPERRERLAREQGVPAFDPAAADTTRAVLEHSGGGVDVVLDLVGAATWRLSCACLRERGRWILVGLLSGGRVEVDLRRILAGRWTLIGTVLRSRSIAEKAALVRRFRRSLGADLPGRTLVPVIDRVLPLARAADAHRAMERNEHFGKIVLEVP